MASYYPSFTYMGLNSLKDKHLRVVAFDADSGEHDTFLGMDPIYTDKYDGTHRIDYGAKFNSTAVIKISVIKLNKTDFTVAEVRDFLKWTTGVRQTSYLDLMSGNEIKCSFLGRVTNAYQQKMDARTFGFTIEFTSVSPWAYSPLQYAGYSSGQFLAVSDDGVLYNMENANNLKVYSNGTLYNNINFGVAEDGIAYVNNEKIITIDNKTDDLYTPIYLNTTIVSEDAGDVFIKNTTTGEETKIYNIAENEVITLSDNQFILSDKTTRIFGNDFNYEWPRLVPGINNFTVTMEGAGSVKFIYRYPIKIGDCAIDMNDLISICGDYYDGDVSVDEDSSSGGEVVYGKVSWKNITNTPTTLSGYGITNAYTMTQVDDKINDVNVDEQSLNSMLGDILDE